MFDGDFTKLPDPVTTELLYFDKKKLSLTSRLYNEVTRPELIPKKNGLLEKTRIKNAELFHRKFKNKELCKEQLSVEKEKQNELLQENVSIKMMQGLAPSKFLISPKENEKFQEFRTFLDKCIDKTNKKIRYFSKQMQFSEHQSLAEKNEKLAFKQGLRQFLEHKIFEPEIIETRFHQHQGQVEAKGFNGHIKEMQKKKHVQEIKEQAQHILEMQKEVTEYGKMYKLKQNPKTRYFTYLENPINATYEQQIYQSLHNDHQFERQCQEKIKSLVRPTTISSMIL